MPTFNRLQGVSELSLNWLTWDCLVDVCRLRRFMIRPREKKILIPNESFHLIIHCIKPSKWINYSTSFWHAIAKRKIRVVDDLNCLHSAIDFSLPKYFFKTKWHAINRLSSLFGDVSKTENGKVFIFTDVQKIPQMLIKIKIHWKKIIPIIEHLYCEHPTQMYLLYDN